MSLDEMLGSLEDQAKLTDEELLIKYAPIFKFESDYLAKVKIVKDDDDSEGDVEEATKRILEAKKKKTSKKELQEQALKKLMLDDVDLLK